MPRKVGKNGGSVTLSTKWAQGILKSLYWVKRHGTTAKREMNFTKNSLSLGKEKLLMPYSSITFTIT